MKTEAEWIAIEGLPPEHIMLLISEEGAEVSHGATKILRFGHDNHHPDWKDGDTNIGALLDEVMQLNHLVRICCGKYGIDYEHELESRPAKKVLVLSKAKPE